MASIDQASLAGVSEPIVIAELRRTRCSGVPAHAGLYLIETASDDQDPIRMARRIQSEVAPYSALSCEIIRKASGYETGYLRSYSF
jgi:hypothetical protein